MLYDHLVDALIEQAEEVSGLPLLRVNWYDSGAVITGAAAAFGLRLYVNVMYGSVDVSDDANFFHP